MPTTPSKWRVYHFTTSANGTANIRSFFESAIFFCSFLKTAGEIGILDASVELHLPLVYGV